ncbi:putative TIM-barrel fold metal-dependent hydrolase [Flavobacterium arsenatis]|uniref:TIM-barrel fold metal-dependent hydrolase n=1 Tax=Flavobacterium arsenatis TaxID=1484332 RepID=A0ABU1TJW7_9FLAO|nr:amidohydrolase family protein [Flavobacterium arsenatis]MDR6966131.1 putative TIM-barrel fold metal-dependent hydrolase [Flavobacterium arsenatis]
MKNTFNTHVHIFNGQCAPKDFLQVGVALGDGISSFLKWLFQTKPVAWIIVKMGYLIPNKMLQFLKIGVMASQEQVLEYLLDGYKRTQYSDMKFIPLTLDMDYMTDTKNKPNQDFKSQIHEMVQLKKTYPDKIFPFYGIDPRNPETVTLKEFKSLFENHTFSGIKLYPANGFFPFDPRLDAMYQYAVAHNIPIMTHCTRGGSYFIGKDVWQLIPDVPPSLNPDHPEMLAINKRIQAYKKSTDKFFRSNGRVCNLFSHPSNYIPVLDKYPTLKLCIAHLGGDVEILGKDNKNSKQLSIHTKSHQLEENAQSWYGFILENILAPYPNTYADISYSLSDSSSMKILYNDLQSGKANAERMLFGTDYFMIQKEFTEMEAISTGEKELKQYLLKMMSDNNWKYLSRT